MHIKEIDSIIQKRMPTFKSIHPSIDADQLVDKTNQSRYTIHSMFTMPSFTLNFVPIEYTFYLAIHRSTASIVALGKFAHSTPLNALDIEKFIVIRLNELLSSHLIEFLKSKLLQANDLLILPVDIPIESIYRAPDTIDSLTNFLIQADWIWLIDQLDQSHQLNPIDIVGYIISLLTELKYNTRFMFEIHLITNIPAALDCYCLKQSMLDSESDASLASTKNSPAHYSKRLHVSNIPFRWAEQHLADEFMPFGQIDNCTVIRTNDHTASQTVPVSAQSSDEKSQTIRSRGYGFVTFHSEKDAEMAKLCKHHAWVCDLDVNGQKIYDPRKNRRIEVNYATVKRSK